MCQWLHQLAQWRTAYEDHHMHGFQRVYPLTGARAVKVSAANGLRRAGYCAHRQSVLCNTVPRVREVRAVGVSDDSSRLTAA